ncbi:MAG: hypothetical protein ACJ786_01135 [Catenulispora sp.]|jgi:hypothetical protein
MASWYLVPCLKELFAEFDRIAPSRDHASDGSIGDATHQQEPTSDHNPDSKGAVHAIDVDSDLHASFSMEDVIQYFVAECRKNNPNGTDRGRLKYFIYNRRIWSASAGWKQEPYTGSSAHTEHAHFSCEYASSYENDTTTWGLVERFGDDMALSDDDIRRIWNFAMDNPYTAAVDNTTSGGYLRYAPSLNGIQNGVVAVLKPYFDQLGVQISGVDTDEAAIVQGVLAGLAGADGAAETIADAVVAALPSELATDVANQILAKQGQAMLDASGDAG